MCYPSTFGTEVANNPWMQDCADRTIDSQKAIAQWMEVYSYLSSEALVYVLPSGKTGFQDLVFVANLGVVFDNTVILSSFKALGRQGEEKIGATFFAQMGYNVRICPNYFEGEAELKHLRDNIYLGGYGIRSSELAYDWMTQNFDLEIIKLEETDPYLYHLDCTVFPITKEKTLVCTDMYTDIELEQIEQVTDIISVTIDDCYSGICNCVRLSNTILSASHIHTLSKNDPDYKAEKKKNDRLVDIATDLALEVNFFNLSEFLKGGALLSCMIMHLNRASYQIELI